MLYANSLCWYQKDGLKLPCLFAQGSSQRKRSCQNQSLKTAHLMAHHDRLTQSATRGFLNAIEICTDSHLCRLRNLGWLNFRLGKLTKAHLESEAGVRRQGGTAMPCSWKALAAWWDISSAIAANFLPEPTNSCGRTDSKARYISVGCAIWNSSLSRGSMMTSSCTKGLSKS